MNMTLEKFIKQYWIDLAMALALVLIIIYRLNYGPYSDIVLLGMLIVIPLWVAARLAIFAYKYANANNRRELALTGLPANAFLYEQLKMPIRMTALPFGIIMLWHIYRASYQTNEFLWWIGDVIHFDLMFASLYLAILAGVFRTLRKLCLKESSVYFVIPFIYFLGALVANIIIDFAAAMLDAYKAYKMMTYNIIGVFVLCSLYMILVRRNWKRACAAYYKFE